MGTLTQYGWFLKKFPVLLALVWILEHAVWISRIQEHIFSQNILSTATSAICNKFTPIWKYLCF